MKSRQEIFRFLAVLITFQSFLITVSAKPKDPHKWGYVPEVILSRTQFPGDTSAAAVIIFDKCKMKIEKPSFNLVIERHVRIQIFKEDGKEYSNVKIPYFHDERVYNLAAQTILPDGSKKKLKKKNIIEEGDKDRWMYKSFAIPAVENKCIVEYKYRYSTERLTFIEPWSFQSEIPTELSRIQVTLPAGFQYNAYTLNSPVRNYKPKKEVSIDPSTNKKVANFSWEFTNLPAITDEPYIKTLDDYKAMLRFQLVKYQDAYNYITFVKNWDDLGKELYEDHRVYLNEPRVIRKYGEEIIGNEMSPRKQAKLLYTTVRDKFVDREKIYMFSPDDPKEVIDRGSTNVDERNILLVGLYRSIGMDAFPVLISTRSHGVLDEQNPRLTSFNRIIVGLKQGGKTLFLDANADQCPFGKLPYYDHVGVGFTYHKDGGNLIKIPESKEIHMLHAMSDCVLDMEGNLIVTSNIRYDGYRNISIRSSYAKWEKDDEDFIKDKILSKVDNVEIDSFNISIPEEKEMSATFKVHYKVKNFATVAGDKIYFSPGLSQKISKNPFKLEK